MKLIVSYDLAHRFYNAVNDINGKDMEDEFTFSGQLDRARINSEELANMQLRVLSDTSVELEINDAFFVRCLGLCVRVYKTLAPLASMLKTLCTGWKDELKDLERFLNAKK